MNERSCRDRTSGRGEEDSEEVKSKTRVRTGVKRSTFESGDRETNDSRNRTSRGGRGGKGGDGFLRTSAPEG